MGEGVLKKTFPQTPIQNHLNFRAGQAGQKMGELSKFSNRSGAGIAFFSRKEQAGRKPESPAIHLVYSEKGTNVGKIIRRPCSHVSDNHLNFRAGQAEK